MRRLTGADSGANSEPHFAGLPPCIYFYFVKHNTSALPKESGNALFAVTRSVSLSFRNTKVC